MTAYVMRISDWSSDVCSSDHGRTVALSDAELSARIRALPQHSLAAGAQKCMSLAGAQHKLAVILRDGQLLQPVGSEPSTHILKPDHPDPDYPHSAVNEWFVIDRKSTRLNSSH